MTALEAKAQALGIVLLLATEGLAPDTDPAARAEAAATRAEAAAERSERAAQRVERAARRMEGILDRLERVPSGPGEGTR
jgi:hypothetical protein